MLDLSELGRDDARAGRDPQHYLGAAYLDAYYREWNDAKCVALRKHRKVNEVARKLQEQKP